MAIPYRRILVPVDGSPTSDRGLAEAIALARLTGARLRLVHVVDDEYDAVRVDALGPPVADVMRRMRQQGETILAAARSQAEAAGVQADTVLHDPFAGRLCDLVSDDAKAWPAELIVLGTHGRCGAERLFMGSDAEQIVRLAPVPVLLVHSA